MSIDKVVIKRLFGLGIVITHCIFFNAMDSMDLFDPYDITNLPAPSVDTDYIDWSVQERAFMTSVSHDVIVAISEAGDQIEPSISFEPSENNVPVNLLASDTVTQSINYFSCHLCIYQTLPTAKSPVNSMRMHMIRQHRGYHYECKKCLEDKQTHESFPTLNDFIKHLQNEHQYMGNHGISRSVLYAYL